MYNVLQITEYHVYTSYATFIHMLAMAGQTGPGLILAKKNYFCSRWKFFFSNGFSIFFKIPQARPGT